MTAQLLTPAATPATETAALRVRSNGRTDRFEPGCSGVLGPRGQLRILDRDRRITAEYAPADWTILAGQ